MYCKFVNLNDVCILTAKFINHWEISKAASLCLELKLDDLLNTFVDIATDK